MGSGRFREILPSVSESNIEIVRRIYDAYVSGDFDTAFSLIDPEVEFDVSIRPEGKVYRGHEGVAEGLRTWTGTWEGFRMELQELIDAGDQVVGVEHQSGRGRGSGLPLSQLYFSVFTLDGGKVTRIVWFPSRAQALAAAGLAS
jgi:ketosteroid isomerase-like protein